jgi:hypothetical protein
VIEDVNYLKGVAVLGMLESVRRLRGAAVADGAIETLNPELRDLLRRNLLTKSGWYPVTWYRELLAALQQVARGGVEVVREASRAAVQHDLQHGIYKVVVRVLSPEWLMRMTPQVFRSYYRNGSCTVTVAKGSGHGGSVSFAGCSGFDAAMWEDLVGGCLGLLDAAGAKNARVGGRRGGRGGDDALTIDLVWDV